MIILGIDPGIAKCGWGCLESRGSKVEVGSFGCVETGTDIPVEKRLKIIYDKVTEIIKDCKPEVLAIEELFFNTNAKTAFVVGQARGVILLAAALKNIPVATYTPLEVKMALTGYGRAEKGQIGQMVKVLLKLQEIPKPDDTADALAVALTHAFTKKF